MDKNVYNMKAEKIQKHVKQGDYEGALKICDTIEWNQVRSARMLSLVSSIYEQMGKYDRAIDILLMAYEEAPVGRRLLYKLTELALAAKEIKDAEEYYKSYLIEAPDDNSRYVLRYKIAEAKKEPIEKRISILEAYKRHEFDEQWSYKLAELYSENNQGDKCASLCDEIILWFGVGTYVDKALELKERYVPLTDEQLNHRNNRSEYEENLRGVQREFSEVDDIPEDIAAILAKNVEEESYRAVSEPTTEDTEQNSNKVEEIPEVAITDNEPAATESGQVITSLDKSAFLPEDDIVRMELPEEEEVEAAFGNTGRVGEKGISSKTKIYDNKVGAKTRVVNVTEEDILKSIAANETIVSTPESDEEIQTQEEQIPGQAEFNWDEEQPREDFVKVDKIIFLGTDLPSQAIELAVEKIKNAHAAEGTTSSQIAKISAVKLNTKGVINSLEALKGKDLIILGASKLDAAIIEEIKKVNEIFDTEKFFILADSVSGIEICKEHFLNAEEDKEEVPEVMIETPKVMIETPEEKEEAIEEASDNEEEIIVDNEEFAPKLQLYNDFAKSKEEAEQITETEPTPDTSNNPASMTVEGFMGYIDLYMKNIDCVYEEGAYDEVKKYIEDLAKEGEILDKTLAEEMVESAADMAEKHGLGNIFKSRYDKSGCLILRGKNFF